MAFIFKFESAEHIIDCDCSLKDAVGALRSDGFDPQEVVDCIEINGNGRRNRFEDFCRGYENQLQYEAELACALASIPDDKMTEVFTSPVGDVYLRLQHNPEFVTVRHLIEGHEWNVPTVDFITNWTSS